MKGSKAVRKDVMGLGRGDGILGDYRRIALGKCEIMSKYVQFCMLLAFVHCLSLISGFLSKFSAFECYIFLQSLLSDDLQVSNS